MATKRWPTFAVDRSLARGLVRRYLRLRDRARLGHEEQLLIEAIALEMQRVRDPRLYALRNTALSRANLRRLRKARRANAR